MTEERLEEILLKLYKNRWPDSKSTKINPTVLEAMKQAVNEALDEAAEKATTKEVIWDSKRRKKVIDKDSILKLKVK